MPAPIPPALASFLDLLRCPTCRARLRPARGALRCPAGHTFNLARHGYASLFTGTRATSGDDAAMARARARFLAGGRYAPIRAAVTRLATAGTGAAGTIVDVGCGTGYYLAGLLDQVPGARGLGLDTSVRALRMAARAHVRAAAASWDVFRPFPLADAGADVVLDVFAPRNPAEFRRVLRPTGRLIVVRPTRRHLAELRARTPAMLTVDPAKERRLRRALAPYFTADVTEHVEYATSLPRQEAADLTAMTPRIPRARARGRPGRREELPQDLCAGGPPPDRVTVSVLATAYRPR